MSFNTPPPSGKKLWRFLVELETQGGEIKPFTSVLMTESQARKEQMRLLGIGYKNVRVLVDDEALKKHREREGKHSPTSKPRQGSH